MRGIYTYKITLSNTTSTATSPNLQVRLNINFSAIRGLSVDLGNIRFSSDQAGNNLLYAWLESAPQGTFTQGSSISSYTSSNIWVNLGNNIIPANGSLAIYMQILSNDTEFDGVYWGANPLWTSTYGQYDNGANIFNFYDNFAGTALSSKWSVTNAGGFTLTVNNGLSMVQTGTSVNNEGMIAVSSVTIPSIIEMYGQIPQDVNTGYDMSMFGFMPSLSLAGVYVGIGTSNVVGSIYISPESKGTLTNYNSYVRLNNIWQISYNGTTIISELNYGDSYSYSYSTSSTLYPAFYLEGNGNSSYTANWVRVRTYPPNGTDPTMTSIQILLLSNYTSASIPVPDWKTLKGKPYVTVSAKGISNGLSNIPNDGADFGPDTLLGASSPDQYGPPYTQTSGIQEAINFALAEDINNARDIRLISTVPYLIHTPIYNIFGSAYNNLRIHYPSIYGIGTTVSNYMYGTIIQVADDFPSGEYMHALITQNTTTFSTNGTAIKGITYWGTSPNGSVLGAGFGANILEDSDIQIAVLNTCIPNPTLTTFGSGQNNGGINLASTNATAAPFNHYDLIARGCGLDGIYLAGYGAQNEMRIRYASGFGRYGFYANGIDRSSYGSLTLIEPDVEGTGTNTVSPGGGFPLTASYLFQGCNDVVIIGMAQYSSSNSVNGPAMWMNDSKITMIGGNITAINAVADSHYAIEIYGNNSLTAIGTVIRINSTYSGLIDSPAFGTLSNITMIGVNVVDINTTSTFVPIISGFNGSLGIQYFDFKDITQNNLNYVLSKDAILAGSTASLILANPPVSGTVYQNTNPFDIKIYLPAYATTSGTAGSVAIALGTLSSPPTIGTKFINGSTSSSATEIIDLVVPAGWYYEFTATGVTFGTATVFPA